MLSGISIPHLHRGAAFRSLGSMGRPMGPCGSAYHLFHLHSCDAQKSCWILSRAVVSVLGKNRWVGARYHIPIGGTLEGILSINQPTNSKRPLVTSRVPPRPTCCDQPPIPPKQRVRLRCRSRGNPWRSCKPPSGPRHGA